jgi:hypothetical protein
MNERWLKLTISLGALGVIVLHLFRHELRIDAVTFGLIVIAILPWLNNSSRRRSFQADGRLNFKKSRQPVKR